MTPVALTKVEELIESLKPYMDQAQAVDVFTLQRFKRVALQNRYAYPWAGFVALGMISVLEWNEEALDENYKHAIALRNDFDTHSSYSTALQLFGKYEMAMHEAIKASSMAPENLTSLKTAIEYAQGAGHYTKSEELLEKMMARSTVAQRESMGINEIKDVVCSALEIIEGNKTSEETITASHRIAFRILRENKTPFTSTRIETDSQDRYVMYYIDIDASLDVVDRLDEQLGLTLFDEIPDFDPDKYWIGYRKVEA